MSRRGEAGARQASLGRLAIQRLTPSRMDDLGRVLGGTWGSGCGCSYPRLTAALERALPGPGSAEERRC